jgi:hypothetical protein
LDNPRWTVILDSKLFYQFPKHVSEKYTQYKTKTIPKWEYISMCPS